MRWEEGVKGKTEQKTLQPPGAKQQGAMRMLLLGRTGILEKGLRIAKVIEKFDEQANYA